MTGGCAGVKHARTSFGSENVFYEARRRIERELDLEEAGIACKKEGGLESRL